MSVFAVFWSVFSRIRTEYGEKRSISPFSVQMRENTDQKTPEYGHFSHIWHIRYFKYVSLDLDVINFSQSEHTILYQFSILPAFEICSLLFGYPAENVCFILI